MTVRYQFQRDPLTWKADKTTIVKYETVNGQEYMTVFKAEHTYEWGLYQAWLAEGNETENPWG